MRATIVRPPATDCPQGHPYTRGFAGTCPATITAHGRRKEKQQDSCHPQGDREVVDVLDPGGAVTDVERIGADERAEDRSSERARLR
jgi:hypothetical protein